MSHELRTPLNGILTFSELLLEQDGGPMNERQLRSVQHIESSGRHLLTLINDILDLSKIEAERMDMYLEMHVIAEICEASLRFVREIATKKGLHIHFSINDIQAMMEVDAKRLKQMLVNLLSNAVKFTPSGGQVLLDVTADAEHEVVRFTVADSGIGIAPEDIGRLFTPFTQLDSGLTRQHDGTGLGLVLVKRLVDLLGGSVSVESGGVGQGSRFALALPWRRPRLGHYPLIKLPQGQGEMIAHALVIEDSPSAAGHIAGYLRELGIQVTILSQAAGLAEHAISLRPDAIFLDLILPGESGWQVLARLKADPLTHDVPVIVVSVIDEQARGLAAGAAAYIVKPLTRAALMDALNKVTTLPEGISRALIFEEQQDALASRAGQAKGKVILVAEDNEVTISALRDYLSDRRYQVVVARNGKETIERAAETRPDLILMDIQMPIMDGLEATRLLRARADFAATPIVALTALAMPGDRERCLAAGADEYLSKPVSLRGLSDLLDQLIGDR
jgi:CheY-like chemotaxis protein/anti-sigma regulatory factor (Ser/Thr protein kinase)